MADCNHDCASCSAGDCAERKIEKLKPNENTTIKHCFAVISGKGGVGKSLVTSLLASKMNKKGYSVAILDADVTGPSIPQAFGLKGRMAESDEESIYPYRGGADSGRLRKQKQSRNSTTKRPTHGNQKC